MLRQGQSPAHLHVIGTRGFHYLLQVKENLQHVQKDSDAKVHQSAASKEVCGSSSPGVCPDVEYDTGHVLARPALSSRITAVFFGER